MGITGSTGSTGVSITGSTGPTGSAITGPTGAAVTGPTGPIGIGEIGPTGFTGPIGYGLTGATGFISATGINYGNYPYWDESSKDWKSNNSTAVFLGGNAGINQNNNSIAIGYNSGNNQGTNAIAIGGDSGYNQGAGSIAIGYGASTTNQAMHSIFINANYPAVSITGAYAGFYVAPIRNDNAQFLYGLIYNTITKEITYNNVFNARGEVNVYYDGSTISAISVNNVISNDSIQTSGLALNQITISSLTNTFTFPSAVVSWGLNFNANPPSWRICELFNNTSVTLDYTPATDTIIIRSASLLTNLGVLGTKSGSVGNPTLLAKLFFSF
jgi:hypothetical protein